MFFLYLFVRDREKHFLSMEDLLICISDKISQHFSLNLQTIFMDVLQCLLSILLREGHLSSRQWLAIP
jgi:hypothetical protein